MSQDERAEHSRYREGAGRRMIRLLTYARPYRIRLGVALLSLLVATALGLAAAVSLNLCGLSVPPNR